MTQISRRDSLKYITLASLATGMTVGCSPSEEKDTQHHEHQHDQSDEFKNLTKEDLALLEQTFFTDEERETVRVLANIIIPADEKSGNAEEAGVHKFIEFMMLDQPNLQTPMRGGLKWINLQATKRYNKIFINCSETEQLAIVDDIAYPDTANPVYSQGVSFFNRFRDFVATGFFSSKIGIEDLQYMGNRPSLWEGAPQEWLDRLGVSYDS
ncbi:gluconate 2-dehydrogenase subunit 3 family protein [Fulvivirgaceae bacterium BMA12]|uniref:Gluconate 2-dehydrogenase subunit 3 family protein n=1 Tax=Agaribacillus aureus TaxID=3051825 RepID=A0ABT8L0Z6_9BACT|nr:gluconate 2-dehydrogenase subunit 3 family protein [Fulvivirgaceae bacterium BMA12]